MSAFMFRERVTNVTQRRACASDESGNGRRFARRLGCDFGGREGETCAFQHSPQSLAHVSANRGTQSPARSSSHGLRSWRGGRRPRRHSARSHAAEESGLYSKKRLGRSAAFTLEADFWNNGGAARNSLS